MSKDHAKHLTDEQIGAEVASMRQEIRAGKISEDEAERDAYFSDPANAEETDKNLFEGSKFYTDEDLKVILLGKKGIETLNEDPIYLEWKNKKDTGKIFMSV